MHMEPKTADEKAAEALRILARLVDRGAVTDTASPMNPDGVVDVYANRIDASSSDRLIAALTDVEREDWTGDSGTQYRSYRGRLFGRLLNIITEQ